MKVAYVNEDLMESNSMFMVADEREYLYSNMDYVPCSSINPIIWKDECMVSFGVFDITNSGDLSVTAPIAEVFMSFDPYGVEVYPNKLKCSDGDSDQVRYIIAINNEVDVKDDEKSVIETKIIKYDPEKHGSDVPEEDKKDLIRNRVRRLYLSEDKLNSLPDSHRHIFRVKNTEAFFFSEEVYNALYEIALEGKASGLTAYTFDTDDMAPSF
ncbi:DUF1629 domain-containing protein [uncultured Photobacterium sp.]|uniref:imm11 family protein n=1 Tax=uncultured Photobacterium sp. TaxID=173973 RepID=UPI00262BB1FB|nr:DUF1629 domain-containing protein [uncultured Photobacterium sp.]